MTSGIRTGSTSWSWSTWRATRSPSGWGRARWHWSRRSGSPLRSRMRWTMRTGRDGPETVLVERRTVVPQRQGVEGSKMPIRPVPISRLPVLNQPFFAPRRPRPRGQRGPDPRAHALAYGPWRYNSATLESAGRGDPPVSTGTEDAMPRNSLLAGVTCCCVLLLAPTPGLAQYGATGRRVAAATGATRAAPRTRRWTRSTPRTSRTSRSRGAGSLSTARSISSRCASGSREPRSEDCRSRR